MEIDGFGEKLVDQLVKKGFIVSVADIFKLTQAQLAGLNRMGEKSATNIINAIEASKSTTFARFLHSLGIRTVGEHSGKVLEKAFIADFKLFMDTDKISLSAIHEIGDVMAESIITYFQDPMNRYIIQGCFDAGVMLKPIEKIKKSGLRGKIFVFTGTLLKFNRIEAQQKVENLGARGSNNVSKKTDYLVVGPGAGSKLDKAEELGVNVITETEFIQLLQDIKHD